MSNKLSVDSKILSHARRSSNNLGNRKNEQALRDFVKSIDKNSLSSLEHIPNGLHPRADFHEGFSAKNQLRKYHQRNLSNPLQKMSRFKLTKIQNERYNSDLFSSTLEEHSKRMMNLESPKKLAKGKGLDLDIIQMLQNSTNDQKEDIITSQDYFCLDSKKYSSKSRVRVKNLLKKFEQINIEEQFSYSLSQDEMLESKEEDNDSEEKSKRVQICEAKDTLLVKCKTNNTEDNFKKGFDNFTSTANHIIIDKDQLDQDLEYDNHIKISNLEPQDDMIKLDFGKIEQPHRLSINDSPFMNELRSSAEILDVSNCLISSNGSTPK